MKILNISERFNRIIDDLREDPACHGITFLYSAQEKILISSVELVYTQILHTLVLNTIQHSFSDNYKREIYIDIILEEGEIVEKVVLKVSYRNFLIHFILLNDTRDRRVWDSQ